MISKTDHYFTYILDDAYIHLAIAKNFALHGVWGMTKYTFSSSSSSPLFTFVLSVLIKIFGNNEIIPLLFNLIITFFILFFLNKYYSKYFTKAKSIVVVTLFTLFFSVLHLQIVTGMEHILQVLVIIINIYFLQDWLKSDFTNQNAAIWFYVTISLLGLIRFESMFYFVTLTFVLLLCRKFKHAFLVIFFGFFPILIYGYFNYQLAGHFFPNSVVVKGTQFDLSGNYFNQLKKLIVDKTLLNVTFHKIGLFPLIIVLILIYRDIKDKFTLHQIISNNFLLIVWSATLLLHNMFGTFRGFFRYEAYIMVAFSMILIPRLNDFITQPTVAFKKHTIVGMLILGNVFLLFYKFTIANSMMVTGSANIYEQQIQSALFLKKYYNTENVVANDIGAICYFSDIHLLDIAGLGSKEMIQFNEKEKSFDDKFEHYLEKYCVENNYRLAVVYEEWFTGHVPKSWRKVSDLKIKNRVNTALDHVVVYSIDPKIHEELKNNIKTFPWNKNVKVQIFE